MLTRRRFQLVTWLAGNSPFWIRSIFWVIFCVIAMLTYQRVLTMYIKIFFPEGVVFWMIFLAAKNGKWLVTGSGEEFDGPRFFQFPTTPIWVHVKYLLLRVFFIWNRRISGCHQPPVWLQQKCDWNLGKFHWSYSSLTHMLHVWYIYLHLVEFYGKCR